MIEFIDVCGWIRWAAAGVVFREGLIRSSSVPVAISYVGVHDKALAVRVGIASLAAFTKVAVGDLSAGMCVCACGRTEDEQMKEGSEEWEARAARLTLR
jgi:hypothetical protein